MGELLSAEKNESEAFNAYEKVVQLSPQNIKGLVFIANWHFQRGENDQALDYYMKAEAVEPRHALVQSRLGKLYSEKNEFDKAKVAFKNAVKLNPQDDNSFYQLGVLLAEKKDYFPAQGALESAISLNDKHADAFLELGKVLIELGEGKEAETKMKKAYKLNPGSNSSYFLAKAQTKIKKYDRAAQTLLRAVKKDKGNHILQYGLCDTYYQKRLFTAAISYCEKAIKLDSGYPETLSRLAWLYARKKKKLDKALEYAREALVSDSSNTVFLSSLSEVYFSLGEVGRAKETISKAIELEPDSEEFKKQMQKFENAN
jgi:tetratricopeptide (TPR) repeat protein